MLAGIDRFLLREIEASVERRQRHWKRGYSSLQAYRESVAPNRARLRKIIGVVDQRVRADALFFDATTETPALVAKGAGYEVHRVRWPVLDGVEAEGLLLEPSGAPIANVVVLPDADWHPEVVVGLAPGLPTQSQFARRLVENNCRVLVPVLIDRSDRWSGHSNVHPTNLPHREMVYRMPYQVGRHIIGYEVQKVLAAIDWFTAKNRKLPIGVFGYGEAAYWRSIAPRSTRE
jgi:hypothetical protein